MANYSISYDINADASGFQRTLSELSSRMKDFFSSIKSGFNNFTDGLSSASKGIKEIGKNGSSSLKGLESGISEVSYMFDASLGVSVAKVIGLLQQLGDEFDNLRAEMVKIAGSDEIDSLESSLKNVLGSGVEQGADTIAKTLAVVNKSFDVTGDTLETLSKKFAEFAHVTGADIPDSVEKVSEAIKKWGLSTNDTSRTLEKLTYASQNSNATIQELLTGITNGQAILSQFGMSMSESIAFLAKLSDNGIKVNTTLWGMRQALSEFSKSGINASEGLRQVTEQIQNATTQTEALNIAVDVFGTKAGAELVQVLKKGNTEIDAFTKELINVEDAIKKDETEMETLSVMTNKMVNSLKSTFSSLGQTVNSIVKVMVQSLMNVVEALSILTPLFDALRIVIEIILFPIRKLMDGLKEVISWVKDFTFAQNENANATEQASRAYENEQRVLENLRTTVKTMTQEAREARIEWLKNRMASVQNMIDDIQAQIDEQKELYNKYNQMTDISLGIPDWETLSSEEYVNAGKGLLEAEKNVKSLEAELARLSEIYTSLSGEMEVYAEVTKETSEANSNAVADFVKSLGNVYSNWEEKLLRQRIQTIQDEKNAEVTRLQNLNATEEEILNVRKDYDKDIKQANLELINFLNEQSKKEFIEKIANAEKISYAEAEILANDETNHKDYYKVLQQIDKYYEQERINNAKDTEYKIKSIKETVVTEYQKKIIQQEIDHQKQLMQNAVTQAENEGKTAEEVTEIKKGYLQTIIDKTKELYELQRQEALQGITDAEEIARINEYWDNEIAYLSIENIEKISGALKNMKSLNYSWDIRLLELDKEAAKDGKKKVEIEKQILEKQRDMALATADEADKDKIIEYYNRRIANLLADEAASEGEIVEKQKIRIDNLKVHSSWSEKLMEQEKSRIEKQIENDVKEAEIAGKSAEEIASIREKGYRDLEKKELKLLKLQEDSAKERAKNPVELLQIEQWYENERFALAEETERKIAELRSGKKDTGDKAEGVNARLKAVEEISSMELQWEEKIQSQKISNLEYTKGVMLSIAKEEGWTNEQIYKNQAWYIDEITRLKRKQLQKEKDDAIANAYTIKENALKTEGLTAEEKKKIEDDYNDTVLQMRKYYLEEDEKLQMQALQDKNSLRDENLKEEESFWNKVVAYVSDSMSEIAGFISQTFGNNGIVSGMLDVFESVKDMASGAFAMLKDIGKSLYEGFKTFFPEANEALQGIMGKIGNEVRDFFSNMPDWLKDAGKQLVKAFSAIGGHLVNVAKATVKMITAVFQVMGGALELYKKAWEGFVKVLDFDPDEALIGLLEFEDKVLTFFMFTLPQLPSYFASALESIDILFDTLFDTVDFDTLFDSLGKAFSTALKTLPKIINKATPSVIKALKAIAGTFIQIMPDLLKAGSELINALFVELPKFISQELPNFIESISNFIPQLFSAGSQLVINIANALPGLLDGILKAFISILSNPTQIGELINALTDAIVALMKTVLTNLPALISGLTDLITEILKAIPDIIIGLLTDPEVWKSVAKSFINILLAPINMAIGLLNMIPFVNIPKIDASNWFADGTNAAPKGLAVVGEAGPELVRFNGGEQVINNRNTQKLLSDTGKSGNNWNITFNNLQDTTAYAMMRQLKQYQREMAINSVI